MTMMRAPGMTMFRMPILTWNLFLDELMVLVAFPVLTGALIMLEADRRFGTHFYDPTDGGSPILFQHLFWFFGHPEVYIVALPFFGVVSEIFPVFSRRPIFGYKGLDPGDARHHGAVDVGVGPPHVRDRAGRAAVLRRHVAPDRRAHRRQGVQLDRHDVGRLAAIRSADAVRASASSSRSSLGGLTGVMLASPTLDFHLSDTYFVVAHFHYVMGGTVVFALFAAIYFWWPKVTGRMLSRAARPGGTSGCCWSGST